MSENVLQKLRTKSIERGKEWRKKAPKKASKKALRDFAAIELFGEVGELCNAIKKILRHDMGWVGGTDDTTNLKEEIGDVAISLDLLAQKYDIDLWEAIIEKFNKTSDKHGFKTKL